MSAPIPGTVVIYGPFFSRSGFGLLARGWALALHSVGVKVKIVPVDCNDPDSSGDLDDTDVYLLHSLKFTPVETPVTAIFAYVPTYVWPKLPLPEPNLRIMLTTFDSTASAAVPPYRLTFICNQMDQVWVANQAEETAWVRGGLEPKRIRSFHWPHTWIDNPLLPPAGPKTTSGQPFRFLHISLFLPRRRLDVLLRAFFEEFRAATDAELILKMTYPSWHPVPGKPRRDLQNLIARLRAETGSKASIVLDETLGTRLDLVRLIDRCDAYVSPDTTNTAPVSEAIIRNRPVIITDGWNVPLPPEAWVVPNSKESIEVTPEMADYMPHQRGARFPALDVGLMRQALRGIHSMESPARSKLVQAAALFMREHYSYAATVPAAMAAIREGWQNKRRVCAEVRSLELTQPAGSPSQPSAKPFNLSWCGLQLFYGKIPTANREICLELLRRGQNLSLVPGDGPFHIEELELKQSASYQQLAHRFYAALPGAADFNASLRWHPMFNERPAGRQILGNTWWAGAIPVDWVKPISEYVDDVWVPSKFVRDNFVQGGISSDQVRVIPWGFNPAHFRPDASPFALKSRKRFKFLYVGETSMRKGLDVLLRAYLATFSRKDDVCLVIKDINCQDYYSRNAGSEAIRRYQSDSRCPEIEYLNSMLTEPELAGLYAACDCFVQPHRTTSFGAAVLEAMACGLPIITTEYGGVLEFADAKSAYLLPARETRRRSKLVGHWRVEGEQLSAEVKVEDLQDRMKHVVTKPGDLIERGRLGRERAHSLFTWSHTVDRIMERLAALSRESSPSHKPAGAKAGSCKPVSQSKIEALPTGPTVMVVAPFYNRSGYGVAARALVAGLHALGIRIRVVPVDNVEPGIDDCDLNLLKSLESTPLTTPLVALFFHVPGPGWLKVALPPQSLRIMFTTYDSSAQGNLPPEQWISVCNQMDQVWLMTAKEASVFEAGGVATSKIKVVSCPHPWIHNHSLPLPNTSASSEEKRFRFLSIAMFMPRRRWDTLIEAYLTEFKDTANTELYLKVNYPSWHPVPGQPQRDLRNLIESLRTRTGSSAAIKLDDGLDTRQGICRLIDSCDAYVSTDTSITAPVGEAFVRGKIAIIPDGYGAALPYCEGAVIIPVDPNLKKPITPEMLPYQPHHQGKQMPLLRLQDVRQALRAAYELPESQRRQMGQLASLVMECAYGPATVIPRMIKTLQVGLDEKLAGGSKATRCDSANGTSVDTAATGSKIQVAWEGSFLDYGSLSHVNRELARALTRQSDFVVHRVGGNTLVGNTAQSPELEQLASRMKAAPPTAAQVTVRHGWPPDWRRPASGKLVVIQPWEFGALPQEWVANSRQVDEFWAPSTYVRDVYVNSGVPQEKVKIVPNGIDPEKFRPEVQPMALATKKSFKFLFVGGTIGRKGSDALVEAYLRQFTAEDDVCLVIKDFGGKTFYSGQTMQAQIKAAQARPNAPEILYLDTELPPDALPGLYRTCDCLVHPYRGEGFGLPILEAMACGLPVIVTAGGAADDFAKDGFAYRIAATRRSIGDSVSGMKLTGPGWLLEPEVQELTARMEWVVENRTEARDLGRRASEYVRREWTWENAARAAEHRVRALASSAEKQTKLAHRRSSAQAVPLVMPPCGLVGHLGQARELLGNKKPREAWELALEALRTRPYHPEAFLFLAETAEAVGDGQAARLCAEHARRLAPDWKAVRQFPNRRLKGSSRPSWLLLPDTAKPSASRLTVCVITKNEERFIEQCLKAVKPIADQIVVVDTGSTDRTIEIAKSLGAEIHQYAWCDDFSAARNAALEHARGDWVLMLDADEELRSDQHVRLRAELQNKKVIACRLPLVNRGQEAEGRSCVPRLFRNAPGVFYSGRIHEQVFPSLIALGNIWGLSTAVGNAQILHHGYTKETVADRNKIERNLVLLRKAIEESPDDPNLSMNLGLELVRSGDLEGGLPHYRQAFVLMSAKAPGEIAPELCEVLLTQFTSHLYKVRACQEVIEVLTSPLAKKNGLTASLHFALGLAYFALKQFPNAIEQMRQCLAKRQQTALSPINTDILTAAPHHCLAMSLAKVGDVPGAEKAFQAGLVEKGRVEELKLDYARFLLEQNHPVDALHRLHEAVVENPHSAASWRLGAQIALSRLEFLEFACDWTSEAIKQFPDDDEVVAQRAEALLLNQQTQQSRAVWETLRNRDPQPRTLAALILCDLVEGCHSVRSEDRETELGPISRAFIDWYRRCLDLHAQAILDRLNERTEVLRLELPAAAAMIETALAEAAESAAKGEPLLV
jgi:glycosyltransferase involved in cell wall biosynthesis/tetratricopeptide (TPR) repeat protein